MPFSAQVVAGVGIGCAVAGAIIMLPFARLLLGWLRKLHDAEVTIEAANRTPDQVMLAVCLDFEHEIERNIAHGMNIWEFYTQLGQLHSSVQNFASCFLRGNGTDPANSYDSSAWASLAGPSQDWDRILDFDEARRVSIITHFIFRTLYRRMIPDGDLGITLLPPDMLAVWQRILTKTPGMGNHSDAPDQRLTLLLRQYWRATTTWWCSETFRRAYNHQLTRPNYCRKQWYISEVRNTLTEDDPRMAHIVATEEALKAALLPLFDLGAFPPDEAAEKRLECPTIKRKLRDILTSAADLALLAFSEPKPMEFYWPSSDRRADHDPNGNDGRLECFGIRQRKVTPGLERPWLNETPGTVIECLPGYNDTQALRIESESVWERSKNLYQEVRAKKERGESESEEDIQLAKRYDERQKVLWAYKARNMDLEKDKADWEGGENW